MKNPTVKIKEITTPGGRRWRVDYKPNGCKRIRHDHGTRALAEAEKEDLEQQQNHLGHVFAALTGFQRAELAFVLKEIFDEGSTPRENRDELKAFRLARPENRITMAALVTEAKAEKERLNRDERYLKPVFRDWEHFLDGRRERFSHEITTLETNAWIAAAPTISARAPRRVHLSILFGYAVAMKYQTSNPVIKLAKPNQCSKPVVILSPGNYVRLLVGCAAKCPRMMGWLVASLVLGMRPEETVYRKKEYMDRVSGWDDIHLKRKIVTLNNKYWPDIYRRTIELKDAEVELLQWAKDLGAPLPIGHNTYRRYLKVLRKILRLTAWPKDITRHTAASYQMAATGGNAAEVSRRLGHKVAILLKHYYANTFVKQDGTRDTLDRETALRILSLRPSRRMKDRANAKSAVVLPGGERGDDNPVLRPDFQKAA